MHFREPIVCEKAEFCESAQILICLHSVNPCLIYRRKLKFLKNLFLVIYCFKVSLVFIKEPVTLGQIFAHLQETEHPDLEDFFDTEVDRTGNPNTNTWNIPQFSSIYTCNFATHTCSK